MPEDVSDELADYGPFWSFPGGVPIGALYCLWMDDHTVATDNRAITAWAPIDSATAEAAGAVLLTWGRERMDAPEGTYFVQADMDPGWGDDEGYGPSYLFTDGDVRWAETKAGLRHVKAPDEVG